MKILGFLLVFCFSIITACGTNDNGSEEVLDMQTEKEDIQTLRDANNELGFNLITHAKPDEAGNVFLSPSSLYFALSLAYNGADGETKTEIGELLGFGNGDLEVLNASNHALLRILTEEKEGMELHIANSLWLNEKYTFIETYRESMENYYQAEMQEIDISDSESPDRINQWVEEQTNERITEIVEGPLNENLIALLINTIYFDGDWMHPFSAELTKREDFYLSDGSTIDVDMMQLSQSLDYLRTEDFQAVSLPYGEGEMSMQIFLPKEEVDLESFQEDFTLENWQKWKDNFSSKPGEVYLPKFKLEYNTLLNDTLQSLGISRAFENYREFNMLVEETDEVWISEVLQKTFLLVDEEGTEAAAATSIGMETTSAPVNEPFIMNVNRPFFLFITDEETGTILFSGKITEPMMIDE